MIKITKQIAYRLKALRKAAGYKSAKSFAEHVHVPAPTYVQHETGKRRINIDTLQQYSSLLSARLSWLITGEGEPYLQQNKEKELNVYNELRNDEYYKDSNPVTLPVISGQRIASIDFNLFKEILRALAPELSNAQLELSFDDLLEFGIDIYNSIIKTTADDEGRRNIINLSVASLKLGISKKGKTSNICSNE